MTTAAGLRSALKLPDKYSWLVHAEAGMIPVCILLSIGMAAAGSESR